ncbi:MAG: VOC family protein [Chloroflexota bacterium]
MPAYTTKIGHAHLKVRDVKRAEAFYTTYFDLNVTERVGDQFIFLSGGEFHHEIALQGLGEGAPEPNAYGVGLYHVAFEVPDKTAFAQAYRALRDGGVDVGAVDHVGISWAMYFNDPDGNGLEIYVDTRHEYESGTLWLGRNRRLTDAQINTELETA